MAKILPPRFGKRGKARAQLSNEMEEASVLATRTAGAAIWAAAKDIFFEPPNPFDSQATRDLRRGVALFCGLTFALAAAFVGVSFVTR
jgi:hypothetical protein